jgi:glycerol uptake facilitator-like aquaporin
MMGANYKKPSQKNRFSTHPQFIKGLTKLLKGVLLTIVLIISTIATFLTDNSPYWNDMAFIVWGLCIVTLVDWVDE